MSEYTQAALEVARYAKEEARRLGYPFVQREQLFLGLLRDERVSRILSALGIDLDSIRQEVESRILPGLGAPESLEEIGMLPTAEQVYQSRAKTAAALLGHTEIGPEHILLGLLLEQHGTVLEVLQAQGVTKERVMAQIQTLTDEG